MIDGSKMRTQSARISFVRVQSYQQLEKFPKEKSDEETREPFLKKLFVGFSLIGTRASNPVAPGSNLVTMREVFSEPQITLPRAGSNP